jgi:hypothetical protein
MNGTHSPKQKPLQRIEAMIEKHQGVPGRFENLMDHIANKLEIRVGTYEKVSFSSKDYDETLLKRANEILSRFDRLLVTFQESGYDNDPRGPSSYPAVLTIRFRDRQ